MRARPLCINMGKHFFCMLATGIGGSSHQAVSSTQNAAHLTPTGALLNRGGSVDIWFGKTRRNVA